MPFCKKIDANEKNFEIIEIGSFKNRTFCKVRIKDEELCWVLKEEVEEKHVHKLLEFYEKRIVIVQESDDDL